MELLQKYLFIPLDIFQKRQQNESINNKRDAWLTLFSNDDPDTIIKLITEYPEFQEIYEEAYRICLNIERVMGMFSEELAVLDRNTVKYMIDEMQNEIDEQKHTIDEQSQTIAKMQKEYHKSIANTIDILRSLNLSDAEIIAHICDKYQLQESQVLPYF